MRLNDKTKTLNHVAIQRFFSEKRKTHDIQATLLHSHRHVFSAEKRKKEESVPWVRNKRLTFAVVRLLMMLQL